MIPKGLTHDAAADWARLAERTPSPATFEESLTQSLPTPIRRWLLRVVKPGTPLNRGAEIRMHGQMKLGAWRTFTAVQRLTPSGGFVWAATARMFGLPVIGFDRYTRASGQMRWRLLNLVNVISAEGPDITLSAASRHAGELMAYLPTAALSDQISWRPIDDTHAEAQVQVGDASVHVNLAFDPDGRLAEMFFPRWGSPDGTGFDEHIFGARFTRERSFAGLTLPSAVAAGWHFGTDRWIDGEFIRYSIDAATFH